MLIRFTGFKLVVLGVSFCGFMMILLNFMSYGRQSTETDLIDDSHAYAKTNDDGEILIRIKADVKANAKPAVLTADDTIPKMSIRTYMISMNHEQDQNVLVREAGEGTFPILLLHGQVFSSKIWEQIGTLQYLASWGYRAIAIDLPGYGNSSLPVVGESAAGNWLIQLIRILRLSNFAILSPSMSGRFALPYVIQSNHKQSSLRAFIPIAPVSTQNFDAADYKHVTIPTLIVHGENDTKFRPAFESLQQLSNKENLIIKNATHSCYVQRPLEFHNGLRQFLYNVYHPIYVEQYKNRAVDSGNSSMNSPNTKSVQSPLSQKSRDH